MSALQVELKETVATKNILQHSTTLALNPLQPTSKNGQLRLTIHITSHHITALEAPRTSPTRTNTPIDGANRY